MKLKINLAEYLTKWSDCSLRDLQPRSTRFVNISILFHAYLVKILINVTPLF